MTTTEAAPTVAARVVDYPRLELGMKLPVALWDDIGFRPNRWAARALHAGDERFRGLVATRQCGKSTEASAWIIKQLLYPHDPEEAELRGYDFKANVGLGSYDYEHCDKLLDKLWSMLRNTGRREQEWRLNKRERRIERLDGSARLSWYSEKNNPAAAEGETFSAFCFDESQRITDVMWSKTYPALSVRKARVLSCGTADVASDQAWFFSQIAAGEDPEDRTHISVRVTAWMNEWMDVEEIMEARSALTEDEFRILYLAQFVSLKGQVFPNADACFTAEDWVDPDPEQLCIMGVDVAKTHDYTVAYVMNAKNAQLLQQLRFNGHDYPTLEAGVAELYRRYNCRIAAIDTNGAGLPAADHLRKQGLNIFPYRIAPETKPSLIHTLQRQIEHKRVILPKTARQLRNELRAYRAVPRKSGNGVSYEAPVGYWDDCVIALALCVRLMVGHGAGTGSVESYATW